MQDPVKLICHEAPLVDLLADLSVHKLDMVLADSPINPTLNIRAYNQALVESGITFFAAPDDARRLRSEYPVSLHGQNILMPSSGSSLRRNLEIWFQRQQIEPMVVAEFEDWALMKTFGERGTGVFTSPTVVEQDVIDKYRVQVVGRSDEITESFFVTSPERHIKHPAINTITQTAKNDLFKSCCW
ncbi:LysR substrate-binding domain-containing protein [Candidatus Thiodiazotropha endoloripes]|uniref:LysR substrate-binding domain-containing protein n=1 Tax=Candidatus Thiodiazotropha endoloripes TaxID=1818881 RepID=UPI001F1C70D7|nr:LysR substrate-binding domain-containing protein [Candidatus Thiodiazotropha endoloripes]